jgi:hypothetical protein
MTDCQFFWYMLVQIVLALSTIALAVIAIWGHVIRAKLYGPRLNIKLQNTRGNLSKFSDGVMSRYYHVIVTNSRRISPAHNVRVVVKAIFRPSADGVMHPTSLSGPVQLAWQYQSYKPQFQTIGAESICDLGCLREGERFTLSTLYRSISLDPALSAGNKMVVILIALSDEVESEELRVEIAWDGKWDEDSDAMARYLVVKPATIAPLM